MANRRKLDEILDRLCYSVDDALSRLSGLCDYVSEETEPQRSKRPPLKTPLCLTQPHFQQKFPRTETDHHAP